MVKLYFDTYLYYSTIEIDQWEHMAVVSGDGAEWADHGSIDLEQQFVVEPEVQRQHRLLM